MSETRGYILFLFFFFFFLVSLSPGKPEQEKKRRKYTPGANVCRVKNERRGLRSEKEQEEDDLGRGRRGSEGTKQQYQDKDWRNACYILPPSQKKKWQEKNKQWSFLILRSLAEIFPYANGVLFWRPLSLSPPSSQLFPSSMVLSLSLSLSLFPPPPSFPPLSHYLFFPPFLPPPSRSTAKQAKSKKEKACRQKVRRVSLSLSLTPPALHSPSFLTHTKTTQRTTHLTRTSPPPPPPPLPPSSLVC